MVLRSHQFLADIILAQPRLAIAVSGGVDSMTLAIFAHMVAPDRIEMLHAVSPAVQPAATVRVRDAGRLQNWHLTVTGTGEFDDPRYRDNPVNRCYFCKTNLYDRIRSLTAAPIASGANLDDLGEYRPGLLAASERDVIHPFVDAGMAKSDIRALARELGLDDVAELPAQPCLASRIETGIAIDPKDLAFVDSIEGYLSNELGLRGDVRCRITKSGVIIELPESEITTEIQARIAERCKINDRALMGLRPYQRGAMFIQDRP